MPVFHWEIDGKGEKERERRDSIKYRVKLLRVLAFSGMLEKEDWISLSKFCNMSLKIYHLQLNVYSNVISFILKIWRNCLFSFVVDDNGIFISKILTYFVSPILSPHISNSPKNLQEKKKKKRVWRIPFRFYLKASKFTTIQIPTNDRFLSPCTVALAIFLPRNFPIHGIVQVSFNFQ